MSCVIPNRYVVNVLELQSVFVHCTAFKKTAHSLKPFGMNLYYFMAQNVCKRKMQAFEFILFCKLTLQMSLTMFADITSYFNYKTLYFYYV